MEDNPRGKLTSFMKKTLFFLFCLSLTFFASNVSWAREYVSEKSIQEIVNAPDTVVAEQGAFSIDIPDGWVVEQDKKGGGFLFYSASSSQDKNAREFSMRISPQRRIDWKRGISGAMTPSDVKEEDLLDYYYQNAISFLKSGPAGMSTIISQKKIVLDGVPAYRIDCKWDFRLRGGGIFYMSIIECFTKEYIYQIDIKTLDHNGTPVQDRMLSTIKLKH